ncbi:MAG: winged helix-turn-helix transcriptional regulator [Candidatus Asgardarchaeia archaeon]
MLSLQKELSKNSSIKLVYETLLNADRPLSSLEIAKACNFSPRTVRYALKKLQKQGLIKKLPNLMDMRRCFYKAVPY